MKKCITLGNWNKNYLYIIAIVISVNIYCLFTGYGYQTYIIGFFIVKDHIGHNYIHKLYYYLLILICFLLYFLYEKKRNSKINNEIKNYNKNDNIDSINNTNINTFKLIYNDMRQINFSHIPDYFVILILFLYVLSEHIQLILTQFFSFGHYWMVELIIMSYLNYKMLNIEIYEHQKLSLYLISIPIILKTIPIVFLFLDENNHFKDGVINYKYNSEKYNLLKSLFVAHWWLFPIAMILFFSKMVLDTYIIINIKKFMDFKYVSVTKLLILYGLFGVSLSSIFSLITTFISCGKKNEDIKDIYDYICKIVDKSNDRFIENYGVYFTGDYWLDLLYTLIGAIGYNVYTFFVFQTVKYFNPVYKSFSLPFIFFIQKIILIYQLNNDEPIKYLNASFFLDLIADFLALLAFLIFLEILELNFCGLKKNLRKYIALRSKIDYKDYDLTRDTLSGIEDTNSDEDDDK